MSFLSSMSNLEKMFDTGLYLNDLSMHDSSRDLVLAGTQQQAELKLALDQVTLIFNPKICHGFPLVFFNILI